MKYINTRKLPVRVVTSTGFVTIDGLASIETDEVLAVPDFVEVVGGPAKKPVVTTTVTTTTVAETTTGETEETTKTKSRRRKTTTTTTVEQE